MSRGSKTFYILNIDKTDQTSIDTSINSYIGSNYPGEAFQEGDLAVDTTVNTANILSTDNTTHVPASSSYQFNGTNWLLTREVGWTDENIIGNVTKIRKAHTEEIRSFINMIHQIYAKRYGDTWYNSHDMSQAVLYWHSNNDNARIYMANYELDKDFLTIECGDNITDLVRFVNRTPSESSTVTNILDIGGDLVKCYTEANFDKDVKVAEDLNVAQKITGDYLINRSPYFYLAPSDNLDEDTGAPTDGRALGADTDTLVINVGGDFSGGSRFEGSKINHNAFRVWTSEYEGHQSDNPDSLGIDSCMIHGMHADLNDNPNTIPVRTSEANNVIKGTIEKALFADSAGGNIYYDVAYISTFSQKWTLTYTFDCTAWKNDFMASFGTPNGIPASDFRVIAIPHLYSFYTPMGYKAGSRFYARFTSWNVDPWKPIVQYGAQCQGWGSSGGAVEVFLIGGYKETFKYWNIL